MFRVKMTQVLLVLLPTQDVRPLLSQSREVLEPRQVPALSCPATAAMLPGGSYRVAGESRSRQQSGGPGQKQHDTEGMTDTSGGLVEWVMGRDGTSVLSICNRTRAPGSSM